MSSSTYCILPFIHVCQTIEGRLKPCCRFQMIPGDSERPNLNRYTMGQALSSSYFRKIQDAMKLGKPVEGCWRCYDEERLGIMSYRQVANNKFGPSSTEGNLSYVELSFSNECNLKCRMCHVTESRKWASDWREIFPDRLDEIQDYSWDFSGEIETFHEIKFLKIVGGEPFLSQSHTRFLSRLAETVDLSTIDIDYHTNSTIFPKMEILNILSRFKHVRMHLSIDAVGKLAEFIRYGVAWEKVDKVARNWMKFSMAHRNMTLYTFPTFQIYNAHSLKDLMLWSLDCGIEHFGYSFVRDPEFLQIEILPESYRQRLVDDYSSMITTGYPQSYADAARFLVNKLTERFSARPDLMRQFVAYDSRLNYIRKQNVNDVAPLLGELINGQKLLENSVL